MLEPEWVKTFHQHDGGQFPNNIFRRAISFLKDESEIIARIQFQMKGGLAGRVDLETHE